MLPGLQFFNFLGDEDGEDIKREFKKRITEAEILLTSREKEDIIGEAESIFRFMVEMVGELDSVMGTIDEDVETVKLAQKHPSLMGSRDSFAVAQERLMRKTKTMTMNKMQGERLEERKENSIEDLVLAPVKKFVRFKDEIRRRPRDGSCDKVVSSRWDDGRWTGVPILAVLMLFLAWLYTT